MHRDYAAPTRRADNPRGGGHAPVGRRSTSAREGEEPMRNAFAAVSRFLGPLLLVALAVAGVEALEKPSRAEIARYRQDGSLRARRERAYELGNHQVKPGLVADAAYRLQLEQWRKGQILERPTPPSGWKGMPTKGNVKILALLIAFSDYPANEHRRVDRREAVRRRRPRRLPARERAELLPARLLQPARDRRDDARLVHDRLPAQQRDADDDRPREADQGGPELVQRRRARLLPVRQRRRRRRSTISS